MAKRSDTRLQHVASQSNQYIFSRDGEGSTTNPVTGWCKNQVLTEATCNSLTFGFPSPAPCLSPGMQKPSKSIPQARKLQPCPRTGVAGCPPGRAGATRGVSSVHPAPCCFPGAAWPPAVSIVNCRERAKSLFSSFQR